ncbi:MAG: C40 family peptidase [Porphyromonas sp.]|jgi:gamma-DL-glutamyl hydrolase
MNRLKNSYTTLAVVALSALISLPLDATRRSSVDAGVLASEIHTTTQDFTTLEVDLAAPAPAPAPKTSKHKRARVKSSGKHRRSHSGYASRRRSGGSGYTYERMEVAESTPSLIKSVVDHGQELLGLRYRTSGVAKWPLDCSGFVSYIYSLEGIKIPRSSGGLSVYADRISDPQPGDLLFFKGRNRGASRVGHVALVISNEDGNIKMIHSSNSRGIVIESLKDSQYFSSRYLGAGRLPEVKEHWQDIPTTPTSLE